MESVPLKDLKENLSHWAEEAAKGNSVLVTKHNRPYIILLPSQPHGLIRGSRVGEPLKTTLKKRTHGKWLKILMEDREER